MSTSEALKQPHRILIVDDNPAIHQDMRKILCPATAPDDYLAAEAALFDTVSIPAAPVQFEIDSAYQGQEGLAMLKTALAGGRPYSMAFVDVRMPPGWDGVETITHLWRAYPELQVVICTAFSDYSWDEIIKQIGRTDSLVILKKPFDNIEVLQLAHTLTEKWTLNREVKGRLRNLDQLVRQRTNELLATNEELKTANERLKQDFTEQIKLENQLRQSQKMEAVGQLAAGIAHDFNNILTVVQGLASVILANRPPEAKDRKLLETIVSASERAAKLVRQLLTFSRRQIFQPQPIEFGANLNLLAEMLPRVLGDKIKLKVIVPPRLPVINGDAVMIEQLLMNLAVNARDAMPEGGQLAIEAEEIEVTAESARGTQDAHAGRFVCLTVTDTGCGMAPEVLSHVFEPFFTTKPVGKGTGLGLATVYGIAQQHHGWVTVQSELSKGATFKVFIPALAKPAMASAAPQPLLPPKGGNETILVVEDEEPVRKFVTEVLTSQGYSVLTAETGPTALKEWAKRGKQIDLLLTDMVMPGGLNGRELARKLLAEAPGLKVIYTSGYSPGLAKNDLSLLEEGSFLAKPYVPSKLLQMVRKSIDRLPLPETIVQAN